MSCQDCDNARKHPLSGRFQLGCKGCIARGISRMPAFFHTAKAGRLTVEYRGVLADQLSRPGSPAMATADHVVGCTGKREFVRFDLARRAAKRRNRKDGGAHVEPYHCRHCNRFHVGERRDHGHRDKRREVQA
jgi:hypothetical protein